MNYRLLRLVFALGIVLSLANVVAAAVVLPAEFADQLVAAVTNATGLVFTPDGRLLITTQAGQLRVYKNNTLLATPALDLSNSVCTAREQGLEGITLDPAFAINHYIYLYYTKKIDTCAPLPPSTAVNRAVRYVLPDSNIVDPASEFILLDNISSLGGIHNSGDLNFGKDGYLYISAGDGGCDYMDSNKCGGDNTTSRSKNILNGKILRIKSDGTLPPDNPWMDADSARCYDPAPGGNKVGRNLDGKKCQEAFAWGLRNPFRFTFDPNDPGGRFFIGDVGQGSWEEINLGQAGADYGWNVREGPCVKGSQSNCGPQPAGMTNPIYAYAQGGNPDCGAITGGAFVPNGIWPAEFTGAYLFSDYVCGIIFTLKPAAGGGYTAEQFLTGMGTSSAVAMRFGPYGTTQALYYTTFKSGGQIRRIVYTGVANQVPTAMMTASPSFGPAPHTVTFNASASSDPDASDTLTYMWDFGDGSAPSETSTPTRLYTYTNQGNFVATLRVRDNHGAVSDPVTAQIDVGNRPPVPQITFPTGATRFKVGETILLHGSATDPEDGTLNSSKLSWKVTLHHNDHTHPYLPPTTGNDVVLKAPAPEDMDATAASYLEIELTATDSKGRQVSITQDLLPKKVNVIFDSQPVGLMLEVNSKSISAPQTLVSWDSYVLNVVVPAQLDGSGKPLRFVKWSDGGLASHAITTPASEATYTVTFAEGRFIWLPLVYK